MKLYQLPDDGDGAVGFDDVSGAAGALLTMKINNY
jgi:hypothetical protein